MIQDRNLTHEEACRERVRDEKTRNMLIGYFEYLKTKLRKVEVRGDVRGFSYYDCGQTHDKRNPEWKPFQHLEAYCKEVGQHPITVRIAFINFRARPC